MKGRVLVVYVLIFWGASAGCKESLFGEELSSSSASTGMALLKAAYESGEITDVDMKIIENSAKLSPDFVEGAADKALGAHSFSEFIRAPSAAKFHDYRLDILERAKVQGLSYGLVPVDSKVATKLKKMMPNLSSESYQSFKIPDSLSKDISAVLASSRLIYRPSCPSGRRSGGEGSFFKCVENDPWSALLFKSVVPVLIDRTVVCTGTVIAEGVVLTAAHCVLNRDQTAVLSKAKISISTPKSKSTPLTSEPFVPAEALGDCLPDCGNSEYDFAILKFSAKDGIGLEPIPALKKINEQSNLVVTIAGYGRTSFPVEMSDGEFFIGGQVLPYFDPDKPISWNFSLASRAPGSTSCPGDSGGPVFQGSPRSGSDRLELIGVISGYYGKNNECFNEAVARSVNISQPGPRSRLCGYLGADSQFCHKP